MPDDTESSATCSSTHPLYDERLRTPVIEDGHHPLNLWDSNNRKGKSIDHGDTGLHDHLDQHYTRLRERHNRRIENVAGSQIPLSERGDLPWRERVKHTTWAYFTMTMATGGLANVLHTGSLIDRSFIRC